METVHKKLDNFEDIKRRLDCCAQKLDSVASVTQQLVSKVDELTRSNAALAARCQTLEDRSDVIENRLSDLAASVGSLQESGSSTNTLRRSCPLTSSRLDQLEKQSKDFEVFVRGLPEISGTTVLGMVSRLVGALGVSCSAGDIARAYLIPSKGDKPRPLIIRFTFCVMRDMWLDN
ncbi:uncharacterized protein [Neodiprion pinetum]|uniref:uncharacterized protein n=1 Tax=Neodiprion pinetum TaxID=441929 RepID=UPI00371A8783